MLTAGPRGPITPGGPDCPLDPYGYHGNCSDATFIYSHQYHEYQAVL